MAKAANYKVLINGAWTELTFTPSSHTHSDYQPKDADLTAIAGLSGTSGLLKKTAANTWSLDTNTYATQTWVNNKGYLTSHQSLANYSTLANTIKALSISGRTITYTKGDGTTGTLTTQDTNTTYSQATSSALGLVKIGYTTSGKNYAVQLDTDGKMYVNVPWTDNNTTYTLSSFGLTATATELNYCDGVTSNIQTQLNNIISGSTPITSLKEANLGWGGKNFSGSYGCIDAAMIPTLGANRLAFMPAGGITVEYSQNGGSTWTAYSTTDANKINLFNGNGASYYIGSSSATGIDKSKYMVRFTIETSTASVYTVLNKFAIYVSTSGSSGCYCTITGRTQSNYTAGTDTWVTFADRVAVSGWSGWNIINTSGITTYGNNNAQYRQLRFTFGVTSHASSVTYPGLIVQQILGFGGVGWTTPSTMAKTGNIFTYDYAQNVTFPAAVKATAFYENGTALSSKYATQTWVTNQGYTKNTGTVTSVKIGSTSYSPSSGVVSLPAYPTTLPASDVYSWAKASSKPSYTKSEVGLGNVLNVASYSKTETDNLLSSYATKTELASKANSGDVYTIAETYNIEEINNLFISHLAHYLPLTGDKTITGDIYFHNNWLGGEDENGDESWYINSAEGHAVFYSASIGGALSATSLSVTKIQAYTSSSSTTKGYGSSGQVLKTDGSKVYWASDTNAYRPIQVNGTQILANSSSAALNLKAGTNITLSNSNGTVTISASGGGGTDLSNGGSINGSLNITSGSLFVDDIVDYTGVSTGLHFGTGIIYYDKSLSGTYTDGMEIATKNDIPKIYMHHIEITNTTNSSIISFDVFNTSSTKFTASTLYSKFGTNAISCSGYYGTSALTKFAFTSALVVRVVYGSSNSTATPTIKAVTDTVIAM